MGEKRNLLEEEKFSLCTALGVEPDEMWRYDGKVYRVHENRRQYLEHGIWWSCADEAGLMEVLENPEGIELRKRLAELKEEIEEIERDMKEWNG